MPHKESIIITVNTYGETSVDFVGFQGATCLAEGKTFRDLLAAFGVQSFLTRIEPKSELIQAQEQHLLEEQQTTMLKG